MSLNTLLPVLWCSIAGILIHSVVYKLLRATGNHLTTKQSWTPVQQRKENGEEEMAREIPENKPNYFTS